MYIYFKKIHETHIHQIHGIGGDLCTLTRVPLAAMTLHSLPLFQKSILKQTTSQLMQKSLNSKDSKGPTDTIMSQKALALEIMT